MNEVNINDIEDVEQLRDILKDLKAQAYDLIATQQSNQANIQLVSRKIALTSNPTFGGTSEPAHTESEES